MSGLVAVTGSVGLVVWDMTAAHATRPRAIRNASAIPGSADGPRPNRQTGSLEQGQRSLGGTAKSRGGTYGRESVVHRRQRQVGSRIPPRGHGSRSSTITAGRCPDPNQIVSRGRNGALCGFHRRVTGGRSVKPTGKILRVWWGRMGQAAGLLALAQERKRLVHDQQRDRQCHTRSRRAVTVGSTPRGLCSPRTSPLGPDATVVPQNLDSGSGASRPAGRDHPNSTPPEPMLHFPGDIVTRRPTATFGSPPAGANRIGRSTARQAGSTRSRGRSGAEEPSASPRFRTAMLVSPTATTASGRVRTEGQIKTTYRGGDSADRRWDHSRHDPENVWYNSKATG